MKNILILMLFITFANTQNKLVGYLPSYRNLDIQKVKLLTDLIFFSVEPDKDGGVKIDPSLIKLLEKGKSIENCRRFICVGGWGKSDNFKHISLDSEKRKVFINNLINLVKKYKLDGVDYDWEHPKNSDEEKAYETLIMETAEKGIKVSMAAASWQKFTPDVFKHLFAVNIMSYDHPDKHSTLEMAKLDISRFIKMGCPPEKINLGVPFYGRHVENRKAMSYNKMNVEEDDSDIVDGYYFNNVQMLRKKAGLVKEKGLSGIMIWEIEQDKNLKLLKSINNALKD